MMLPLDQLVDYPRHLRPESLHKAGTLPVGSGNMIDKIRNQKYEI
jgi:hypothetical protein